MAYNAILSHTKHIDEIIQLSLQKSHCLSILTYGVTAVSVNVSQYNELHACCKKLVRSFIDGLGRLDYKHLVMT